MAASTIGKRIDDLIAAEQWAPARKLIEKALEKDPDSHWLISQLGETFYEQRRYKKALDLLLRARDIVPDCPLTLWYLANTLDALGHSADAVKLYSWLLRSKKTAEDDPCWESEAWADGLKTDCVYRLGLCFKRQGRDELAAYCLRKYMALDAVGSKGSYSIEKARGQLQKLNGIKRHAVEQELQEAAHRVMESSGEEVSSAAEPPRLDRRRLRKLQRA